MDKCEKCRGLINPAKTTTTGQSAYHLHVDLAAVVVAVFEVAVETIAVAIIAGAGVFERFVC